MTREEMRLFVEWVRKERGVNLYICEDETGGFHTFHPSVGDELRARGVIFGYEGNWKIKQADANTVVERYAYLAICDFCSERPVAFDVECASFADAFGGNSVGNWAACQTCGEIIKRRGTRALVERVLASKLHQSSKDDAQEFAALIRPMIQENMRRFWQHYRGIRSIKVGAYGH